MTPAGSTPGSTFPPGWRLHAEACRRAPRPGRRGREPGADRGSAPPAPSSATSTTSSRPASARTRTSPGSHPSSGRRSPATRRRRSSRGLDRAGQPVGRHVELDGRSACGGDRSRSAAASPRRVSTSGWIPRASSRSSLTAGELVDRGVEERGERGIVLSPAPREPKREQQRHQPLLRAVVQIALEPTARVVGRRDDPCARRPHLLLLALALGDVGARDEEERTALDHRQRGARPEHVDDLAVARQPATRRARPSSRPRRRPRSPLARRSASSGGTYRSQKRTPPVSPAS